MGGSSWVIWPTITVGGMMLFSCMIETYSIDMYNRKDHLNQSRSDCHVSMMACVSEIYVSNSENGKKYSSKEKCSHCASTGGMKSIGYCIKRAFRNLYEKLYTQ